MKKAFTLYVKLFLIINLKGDRYMNEYMKIAKELSEENLRTHDGGPFGACIVKDGIVIGRGRNMVIKNNDPTAHAEMMAIRDACANIGSYDLSGCELYTSCYPCPMCLSATIWSNIKKVCYGNTKEDADAIGFRDDFIYDYIKGLSGEDVLDLKQLDRVETIKTFDAFASDEEKTIY
jgi:tRNA(Arg) A34 adenosine deaminase TadA